MQGHPSFSLKRAQAPTLPLCLLFGRSLSPQPVALFPLGAVAGLFAAVHSLQHVTMETVENNNIPPHPLGQSSLSSSENQLPQLGCPPHSGDRWIRALDARPAAVPAVQRCCAARGCSVLNPGWGENHTPNERRSGDPPPAQVQSPIPLPHLDLLLTQIAFVLCMPWLLSYLCQALGIQMMHFVLLGLCAYTGRGGGG